MPPTDKRGLHENRPHAISQERKDFVKQTINRFSRYTSHYSRRSNPNKSYITSVHSISEMYKVYVTKCTNDNIEPVREHTFRDIFNTEYNIGFKLPSTDTCKVCDEAQQMNPKPAAYEVHLRKAEAAYGSLRRDKARCKNTDSDTLVITMNLQQALPTPHLSTECVFYQRQLRTYNFGIHICNSDNAIMCVWPESVASRGSDEIASCLLKAVPLIEEGAGKRKLIVYSDSCVGQNKNFTITGLWMYTIDCGWFEEIEHTFLVPGHTFLPCDADFGIIEKVKRKTQVVYVPGQWADLIGEIK